MRAVERQATEALLGAAPEALSTSPPRPPGSFTCSCEGTLVSAQDLRELGVPELTKRLQDARQELFNLRLQRASGKLLNPARVVLMRRTVARLLTVLGERGTPGGGTS